MRKSLLEQLKEKNMSYVLELRKIINLLHESYSDAYSNYSKAFKLSRFSLYFEDLDSALLEIFEDKNNNTVSDDVRYSIEITIHSYSNLTLDSFLNYLELFKTLSSYILSRTDANTIQIRNIIDNDCDLLGYVFVKDDDCYRVKLKNAVAEATKLSVKEETASKIDKYLMIRSGNTEEKRNCIKMLADDIEILCKQNSNIKEYDKLKQFIQCVRHTKEKPKVEFPFYYQNEEEWLDKTFDMIIGALSFTRTKEIVSEIIDLENKKTNKK